jgi:hypothetical protein
MMGDIKSPTVLWIKWALFLALGLMAAVLVVLQAPSVKITALLALAVWAFCRCYYFAFYVIEHYVDPSYRFSGLISFARYAIGKRRGKTEE